MTNPTLPTAAEALAMAYAIVRTPCSAAETQRAELLFELGRELRVAADMRTINARRLELDRERAADKLRAAGIPSPSSYEPKVVMPFGAEASAAADRFANERPDGWGVADFAATQVITKPVVDEPTQYVPQLEPMTQRLEIEWSVGDRADCRHCHTPIVFVARRMIDAIRVEEDDPQYVWVHKYTDRRVCEVAPMGQQADGEHEETYASPSVGPAA